MPLLVFLIFLALGLALRAGTLADPDTGWHIAAGDLIRELGKLPETDPWSFTAGDYPWRNISWAYDVALSFVHDIGGLPAVAVATILCYALTTALVAWIAMRSSSSLIASFAATILCGFVLLPGMLARPQSLTFLLIVAFYAFLRFGGRALWVLPLLMIPWANVHGGFLTAFVIMGAFFGEAFLGRDYRRARRLAFASALCGGALMINPYGWGIFEAASLTMGSAMKSVIAEWRPQTLGPNAPTFLLFAVVAVSAVYEKGIPLADKLLALFWLAMGLMSGRMMQIAAILAAPYLAQALALRLKQLPVGAAFAKRDASYAADFTRPVAVGALAAAGAFASAAALAPPAQRALGGEAFVSFPKGTAPDGAMDFLAANYPDIRVYNEYGMGGYMIYRGRGTPRVFSDGRADTAFPREVLKDAVAIGYMGNAEGPAEPEWRALVERYRIDGFLLSRRMHLYDTLLGRDGWTKVFEDESAALFVRANLVKG